jgi:hypothetical protein
MKKAILATVSVIALAGVASLEEAQAGTVSVTFTELPGLTGGSPAATGVYQADLSGLGTIASVTILDNSSTSAGAPGQFSGFDLDAIVLSSTNITNASQVGSLVRTGTFNFATSVLTGGVQTPPVDPALFGTIGGQVNNAVATLDSFDGNSTTAIPGAFGFVSLGVGGKLSINLTSAIVAGSPLFLYIGEVGNNGEVAAGTISVSSQPIGTPLPATLPLLATGLGALGLFGWRRRRKAQAVA